MRELTGATGNPGQGRGPFRIAEYEQALARARERPLVAPGSAAYLVPYPRFATMPTLHIMSTICTKRRSLSQPKGIAR